MTVRDLREKSGLTGEEFGALVGINYYTVRKIERGLQKLDVERLKTWLEYCHVTFDEYFNK